MSVIIGLILSVAEPLFTKVGQYSIGNVILVVGVFLYSLRNPEIRNKPLEFIGSKCCFWIYILHPIVIHIWNYLTSWANESSCFQWITPICVLILTVTVSVIIEKIKMKFKLKNGKELVNKK